MVVILINKCERMTSDNNNNNNEKLKQWNIKGDRLKTNRTICYDGFSSFLAYAYHYYNDDITSLL